MKNKVKYFFSDVDGVWNNDCYYYQEDGKQLRKFSTKDSAGLLLLKAANIQLIILSGDDSDSTKSRFKDLGIDGFYGIKNKGAFLQKWILSKNLSITEIAYIGNDINDVSVFKMVQLSYAPNDTNDYVRKFVSIIFDQHPKPGNGFFRFIVEKYLSSLGILDDCYSKIINDTNN
tara:strand:+ start:293 stop:814 length:522 start_codon:yes stop_codon:yes gene_type:complete